MKYISLYVTSFESSAKNFSVNSILLSFVVAKFLINVYLHSVIGTSNTYPIFTVIFILGNNGIFAFSPLTPKMLITSVSYCINSFQKFVL